MRWMLVSALGLALSFAAGCAASKSGAGVGKESHSTAGTGAKTAPVGGKIVPDLALSGRVVSVNPTARYVVLRFPVGRMPAPDQTLSVYRQEVRVGEVKVGGFSRDAYATADILQGDCQVGDEVRDR